MIRLTLLLFLPIVLSAQVEIFGHIRSMWHSEDEGCGSHRGTSYGGGVIVPFFGDWTVEGDFQTSYDPRNRGPTNSGGTARRSTWRISFADGEIRECGRRSSRP